MFDVFHQHIYGSI